MLKADTSMAQPAASDASLKVPASGQNRPCGKLLITYGSLALGDIVPSKYGKLGYEDHLEDVKPYHYQGSDSQSLNFAGSGSYSPHTTNREKYYINSQWGGFDWSPTYKKGVGPRLINSDKAKSIRKVLPHLRPAIKSTQTNKILVVSIEESGPAKWVTKRDGINFGAPPEVYHYLGGKSPYTGNPQDENGKIKVIGFLSPSDTGSMIGPCTY